jgi:ERCC4-type nuclease
MPLSIIIDTREQTPWHFPPYVATAKRGTLRTGDYALEGDLLFGVERKSIQDFVSTVAGGWDRFNREIDRMDGWAAKVVIVEGCFRDLCFRFDGAEVVGPQHESYKLTPTFLMKRISELSFRGVSVLFCDDPDLAAAMAASLFRQRQEQIGIQLPEDE